MASRRLTRALSPKAWSLRAFLALLALCVGYASVSHALAQALARRNPTLAYNISPGFGRIAAKQALGLSAATETNRVGRERADKLAKEALLGDPTTVPAVSALGLNAEVRGDRSAARRLFSYAQRLSRRALEVQLWAIEDAVARNDVEGALHHYDIALRTSGRGANVLVPVLASAASDPVIRIALVRTLAAEPNWGESFLTYIADRGTDPLATADLFQRLRRADVHVPESARPPIVSALLQDNKFDQAWQYYVSEVGGGDRRFSRDPSFASTTSSPTLFDWRIVNEGGVSTSIQRDGNRGLFEFSVPAGIGGALVEQVQILPPGTYLLSGSARRFEPAGGAMPYWVLLCGRQGRELGRVELPRSPNPAGEFSGTLIVPTGCPMQVLALIARATDGSSGLSGQIDRVQLRPR